MLHFFPTPYPGEWWYSVLCRYHARTGNPKFVATIEELFGGRPRATIGSAFPNNTIYDVISRLPKGLFDIQNLILNHTLFLYDLRMAPLEKKKKILDELCDGRGETIPRIWSLENKEETKLKYCPICRKNDMNIYGETYWRVGHQISLITVCPKHECKLQEVYIGRRNRLKERFYLPNEHCIETEPDYNLNPYEVPLAKTLDAYSRLPIMFGPTEGYNNLVQAFLNNGYMKILKRYNISLDIEKLHNSLVAFYGPDLTSQMFGNPTSAHILGKIYNWSLFSPERYALLATMIGQPPDVTFGPRIPDAMKNQLYALKKTGTAFPKKYIGEQLGIRTYQVDSICRRYGIEPFWAGQKKKQNDGTGARKESLKMYCTTEEKEMIEAYAKEKNFANISDFIRYCVFSQLGKSTE